MNLESHRRTVFPFFCSTYDIFAWRLRQDSRWRGAGRPTQPRISWCIVQNTPFPDIPASRVSVGTTLETEMDEETFNLSMRKFLKMVGVSAQHEIERAVSSAVAARTISGTETFPASATLEVAGLKLNVKFSGEIKLH